MQRLLPSSRRTPVVLGILGLILLAGTFVVPGLTQRQPDWPVFTQHKTECHAGRRTVRHRDGVVQGGGSYEPCLIDTGMTTGEPGVAITRDGTLLRSVTEDPVGIAVSSDNGATWTRRPLPAGARDGIPDGYLDPVTDRYFYSALGNSPVYSSDDKGITWQTGTFDSPDRYDWNRVFSGVPVTPRADGFPTNIYYCNMTKPGGFVSGARCFKSVDGGRSFKTTGPDPYKDGDCKDRLQPQGSGLGRGIVDPRDGAMYLPTQFCSAVEVLVSRDEGASWTRQVVFKTEGSGVAGIYHALASRSWRKQMTSGRINVVSAEMGAGLMSDGLAMDASGRLFMVWIDQGFLPVLVWSEDKGLTWSRPVRIQAPGVVQAVMPSIAIAPDGRVGISYYGSTDKETWTGYLAISEDATALAPIFETAAVTRDDQPLMPEACCWASGPQEYTIARWAPDGSLWGAFSATRPKGHAWGVLGRLVKQ